MRQTACVLILAAVATVACGRSVNVERERAALLQLDRDWSQTTRRVDLSARNACHDRLRAHPRRTEQDDGDAGIFSPVAASEGVGQQCRRSRLHDGDIHDDRQRSRRRADDGKRQVRRGLATASAWAVESDRGHLQRGYASAGVRCGRAKTCGTGEGGEDRTETAFAETPPIKVPTFDGSKFQGSEFEGSKGSKCSTVPRFQGSEFERSNFRSLEPWIHLRTLNFSNLEPSNPEPSNAGTRILESRIPNPRTPNLRTSNPRTSNRYLATARRNSSNDASLP